MWPRGIFVIKKNVFRGGGGHGTPNIVVKVECPLSYSGHALRTTM